MAMGSSGSHKLNSDKSDGRKYEEVALEMDTPEATETGGDCEAKQLGQTERWFTENIKKKECAHFVSRSDPSDDREEVCCCGNAKRQHKHENARHTEPEWIPENHIKEMPTDAFGEITFKGPEIKKAKYVRASDSTSLEVLYIMMTDKWKLKKPKLVISIAGGAENFYMHPRLKNLFSKGLLKAARSTGAWIFTSGCHAGVAKLVGEAMRDFSESGRGYHEIVTIGIAPWGTIHNRDMLIRKGKGHTAEYHLDVNDQGGHLSLDDNHSHFILVDDGTQGDYWAEMPLRTDLERFISEQGVKEGINRKIPIVCVVLAGGLTTVDVIDSSLTNEMPCVIVEGSGHVADLIAQMAHMNPSQITIPVIQEKMFSLFPDKKIDACAEKIQDIVRMSHLLTIFREDKGSARYLDVTMALLKASQRMDKDDRAFQLKLALLWNRLDIAENDIFNSDWKWKPEDLSLDITDALIEKKPKFVQLFLDQGVRLRDYVTEENLTDLYEKIKATPLFSQKLNKMQKKKKKDQDGNQKGVDRSQVKVALKSLCRFTDSLYSPTEEQKSTPQSTPLTNSRPLPTIEYLIRDLLIWAVIQNRGELAEIIWTECKDCVVGALACSMIFRALSKQEKDTNNAEEMKVLADQFDERASGVFSECCTKDEGRAEQLLELKSFGWGNSTCMELAANAKAMNFMSNGGVQNYLNKMWYGKLSESNSPFRLFICMVLFPLICTGFITFRENTEGEKDHTRRKCQEAQVKGDSSTDESGSKRQEESGTLGPLQRLRAFFAAPVVIFCLNVGSHIGFLLLFAYVLLMDFQPTPSWREYLLYVWVSSLLVEEVRQLFQDLKGTEFWFCYYIRNFWNQMDVVAIFLFIVGFVCRWSTATFYARVILAVDFIVFCLRLIDNFTVNRSMGPKIITVQKMIKDFCFFLLLLAVWVVSFGVSKQAILVHNEHRLDWIIRNVLYEPYFTLFGQIPPDVDKLNFNNSTCTSDGSDASLPKCAEARDGVPIVPEVQTMVLLFVYLLFTIILPLNLLIAMFSHTFSEVQDNTDQFWKFQRHKLITEYSKRPPIPPPLILFNHMCRLGKCLVKKCLRVKCKNCDAGQKLDGNNITGLESDKNNITALLYWEEEMKKKYLFNQRNGQNQSSDKKRRGTSNKIDPVVKLIELEKNVRAIEQRLIRQEEKVSQVSQVSQCTMALDWIMKSLTEKGLASEEKAPVMESSRPQTH